MLSRRTFLAASAATLAARRLDWSALRDQRPVPSHAQLAWQRDELALFLHFGVNTFTDREWGDGTEDPAIFNPQALDARQWARSAKAAGFRAMILTAKHHDGFCLWPSKTTRHSVASSRWRDGHGDVVREFVTACRAEGLKPGLYCSPWDRYHPAYGDSPKYNDVFCEQITELLTQYGEIHEVWFDGANGEGPNGKKQVYDFPRFWGLVKKLQPNSVIFSDAGPDVRWIGNERGVAGETNWSTVDPSIVTVPGMSGNAVMRSLQQGDRDGSAWRPGETDVSIRPGWFYHAAEDARVKTADQLVSLYFTSVGRNSKLLLNVPPTRDGLLHTTDTARLADMRTKLSALFARDLAKGGRSTWRVTGERAATLEIDLGKSANVSVSSLREDIEHGQLVAKHTLEASDGGEWHVLSRGTTIGYCRLDRFAPMSIRRVRLTIEDAAGTPQRVRIGLFE
ncbi:MAG TPA: alpha-L-fucosidase [Gemmatimonadaceae bacterium]|nr:alpha-L-fucosidase [Gemmatimonadaceae bacterium]